MISRHGLKRLGIFITLCSGVGMLYAAEKTDDAASTTTAPAKKTADDALESSTMIETVDTPTADILDAGTYSTSFRLYSQGGLMSRLLVAPFRRLNMGLSFDVQRLIGSGSPHMITPAIAIKIRAFDGNDILPALALGYEGQGYLYQDSTKHFLDDRRGLYLVGSHEILLPDMELHAGVNVPDVEDAKAFGFIGSTYHITSAFALLVEYDNIRNAPQNRINIGGRFWITPSFNVDLAARNVGRDGVDGAERILRLNYVGNFPF
jgi:hypothetical protein